MVTKFFTNMKMFFIGCLSLLGLAFTSAPIQLSGLDQLKSLIAAEYSVPVTSVYLISPDLARVNLGSSTIEGAATFNSCGIMCTEVNIDFPSDPKMFIVEDDLGGF